MRLLLALTLLTSALSAKDIAESSAPKCDAVPDCLEGFYKVPDFLYFKGGYVYVFVHDGKLFAYGVKNLDGSPATRDSNNPNKLLRERLDKEVVFLQDLAIQGLELLGGTSYNFQNGTTYYTKGVVLENGDLELEFALDSYHLLSKALVWERLSEQAVKEQGLRPISKQQALETLIDSK